MNYIGIEGGDENSEYFCEISERRIAAECLGMGLDVEPEPSRYVQVDPFGGFV